jgi:hypothetical protein
VGRGGGGRGSHETALWRLFVPKSLAVSRFGFKTHFENGVTWGSHEISPYGLNRLAVALLAGETGGVTWNWPCFSKNGSQYPVSARNGWGHMGVTWKKVAPRFCEKWLQKVAPNSGGVCAAALRLAKPERSNSGGRGPLEVLPEGYNEVKLSEQQQGTTTLFRRQNFQTHQPEGLAVSRFCSETCVQVTPE